MNLTREQRKQLYLKQRQMVKHQTRARDSQIREAMSAKRKVQLLEEANKKTILDAIKSKSTEEVKK
jgi:hypothetical protein